MKNIYYIPFSNSSNQYCERMKKILSKYGNVKSINKHDLLKKVFSFNFGDYIFINWLENRIINEKGKISSIGVCEVILFFLIFKFFFKKFIFVKHNHYPHECSSISVKKAKIIMNLLEIIADIVIVHSPVEVAGSKKKLYVPHPLYHNDEVKSNVILNSNEGGYIVFGRIVRYKKLEETINFFPPDQYLIIAGKCEDIEYLNELEILIVNKPNITIISRFLDDQEIKTLIHQSKGVLITHNDKDMIVSGSFFYAISIKSRVYCLRTPFFSWVERQMCGNFIRVFDSYDDMRIKMTHSVSNDFDNSNTLMPNQLFGDDIIIKYLDKVFNSNV